MTSFASGGGGMCDKGNVAEIANKNTVVLLSYGSVAINLTQLTAAVTQCFI